MKLYKLTSGILLEQNGEFFKLNSSDWDAVVNQENLHQYLQDEVKNASSVSKEEGEKLLSSELLAPISQQEVWASGVTYFRSRVARMEESKDAGGGDFYDRVYDAERPELFFKATPARTVGSGGKVNIRQDSTWDVPEPELTLFVNSRGKIQGYTVGNDMSSRSIEGENPLYLPQAKTYDKCAGIGPCLYVPGSPLPQETEINLEIKRNGETQFNESIAISQMKRKHDELVGFLFRETSFEHGAYLMTGTGIVPPNEFTLKSGDEIRITIGSIGTLVNFVS
ncbi:fumarylacetoacetate hydrolase family protein [Adhaeribacter aquaticus]|uniref:fumarylacetoacetate hydrolase family protein n=1 Tax=Adhaeribacter aquaticus TaxID=299567 RepID=UPI00040EEF54|nr:fumarylacetoacetate hydrolase family protein [Adhaeribacter aquaticus]